MKKTGRPKAVIDWKLVENLCHIQCTQDEIAATTGICVDTINTRCKEDHGMCFSAFFAIKREGGRASLRRSQWLNATKKENVVMQIWLGKQYLEQKDKHENELSQSGPIKIEFIEKF